MPAYISEFNYYGTSDQEFIEVAVPTGTDVSGYSLVLYQADGTVYKTVSLGSYSGTFAGQDVYVVDQSTPNFDSGGDPTGTFYTDDAIALVDDGGTVLQFLSWEGNTIAATEGPASGTSSTDAGFTNQSLQSDNGGASYYAQPTSNKGTIPACYAPGTLIDTPKGQRPIEELRVGDLVTTLDRGNQPIRWIWDRTAVINTHNKNEQPVLIKADALAPGIPNVDLIVSPQHRILLGAHSPLGVAFGGEVFVPAKFLTSRPGIRFMRGKKSMRWLHFACQKHEVIRANGCRSESLLLGSVVSKNLPFKLRASLRKANSGMPPGTPLNGPPARLCLTGKQIANSLNGRAWVTPNTQGTIIAQAAVAPVTLDASTR